MARYGEYGTFTPSESAYVGPGDFERAVLGEAVKRGSYLSQMDQFYAELEQMEKELTSRMELETKKLEFQERKWGEELAWMKEQEVGRTGLEQERIAAERYRTRMAYGKTDMEKRREAGFGTPSPAEKTTEGTVPLSWLSEQMKYFRPQEGSTPQETSGYGNQTIRNIYFSNPMLGTTTKV